MNRDQRNEEFETPTHDEILALTPVHVSAMEQTDDDMVWVAAGMSHLLLTTVGRKSGNEHKTPLPYWLDENDDRIVVASMAGAPKSPAWFHNLSDKDANPTILVRERSNMFWSDAEVLDGDDYQRTWQALTDDRPFYLAYQEKTERRIPLVRLPETAPYDG